MISRRSPRRIASTRPFSFLNFLRRGRERRVRRRQYAEAFEVAEFGTMSELLEDRTLLAATLGLLANTGNVLPVLYQEFVDFTAAGGKPDDFVSPGFSQTFRFDGENVQVELRTSAADFGGFTATLAKRGFNVSATAAGAGLIEGFLPLSQLNTISRLPETISVLPIWSSFSTDAQGSVTNQAEATFDADDFSGLYNVDGTGVTIGVISDSANQVGGGLSASVASGDLPAGIPVLISGSGGSDEGRAMMELIYDIAPGASLIFASGVGGDAGMAAAINALAAAGADIIVDDLNGLTTEPYFQDGLAAQAVTAAVAGGATYFTSAGNRGAGGYDTPADFSGGATTVNGLTRVWHDFNLGAGTDNLLRITLPTGNNTIIFQYDQPFGSVTSDLDVRLFDTAGTQIAGASELNTATQVSREIFSYNNTTGSPLPVDLAVDLVSGAAPTRFKFIVRGSSSGATINEHQAEPGAFVTALNPGHNGSANAISVAAAPFSNPTVAEAFTSVGPVTRTLTPAGAAMALQVINRPIFTSLDGTATSVLGFSSFFGTSAAAPNAAAVGALLLDLNAGLTPSTLQTALVNGTTDIGAAGFDFVTGNGLINAFASALDVTGGVVTVNGDRIAAGQNDAFVVQTNAADPSMVDVLLNSTLLGTFDPGPVNSLVLNGLAGDDSLTVDYANGDPLASLTFTFNGGANGAGGDTLEIQNGTFTTVSSNYTNANDGNVDLDGSVVNYTGLEPVLINVGSAANMIFNLPAAATVANLEDDGSLANGMSRLRSGNGTFEVTTFVNPTNSLTINGQSNADTINITPLDNAYAASTRIDGGGGVDSLTANNVNISGTSAYGLAANSVETVGISNSTFNNNFGDGVRLTNVGAVTTTNVTATGNDTGLFIGRGASFNDTDGNFSGNNNHGIQLIDIAGDVTLTRTTANNNDADNNNIGDGLNASDGSDGDALSIGGRFSVFGATFSDTDGSGTATHQFRGVNIPDALGNDVSFLNSGAIEVTATGNLDDAVHIDAGVDAFFTNGVYSDNFQDGLDLFRFDDVFITDVTAKHNGDDGLGVNFSRSVKILRGTFNGNGDDGYGVGDISVSATFIDVDASFNGDDGMHADPIPLVTISGGTYTNNFDEGINLDDITTVVIENGTIANNNGGDGVQIDSFTTTSLSFLTTNNNGNTGANISRGTTLNVTDWVAMGNHGNVRPGNNFTKIGTVNFRTTTTPADVADKVEIFQKDFQHTRALVMQDFVAYTVIGTLNFDSVDGMDSFVLRTGVSNPANAVAINLDGGTPSAGPNARPGDNVIMADIGGTAAFTNANTGTGVANYVAGNPVNFTDIEEIVVADEHEFNGTRITATVLGSDMSIITGGSIHNTNDEDFYKITAKKTGVLQVNFSTLFGTYMDLDMQILDGDGDVIATLASITDNEFVAIPVIAQKVYYVRVFGKDNDSDGMNFGNYNLEIENTPLAITPQAVHMDPTSDSGMLNNDNVTANTAPRFIIQADLAEIVDPNNDGATDIAILSAAQAAGGVTPGVAVWVSVTNSTTGVSVSGFASQIGASSLFSFTPAAAMADDVYFITSAVQIIDSSTPNLTDRGPLSVPLWFTVDTVAPVAGNVTLDMLTSSDSLQPNIGTNSDDLTNIKSPAFDGVAEANAKIRVLADGRLVGSGVVNTESSDGNVRNGLGTWEVTVEPLTDGPHNVTLEVEDAAGNITRTGLLPIVVDTLAPQRPTIDLLNADDSGMSNLDNVTNDNTQPRFRVSAEPGSWVVIKDGETVIDSFAMPAAGFTTRPENLAEGPHPLSAEATDAAGNRSAQSQELMVAIDTVAPTPDAAADLLTSSDTGMSHNDNVTSKMKPAFVGAGVEANLKVRVYANNALVGQGMSTTFGTWEITVEPLADGVYTITTELEDIAGNIGARSPGLRVVIDTVEPNTPYLDLLDDSGHSATDNITSDNTPQVSMTSEDPNIAFASTLFQDNLKFRIFDRFEASAEFLLYDSTLDSAIVNANNPADVFTALTLILETLPEQYFTAFGENLPAVTVAGTLADGVHNLKLEVEDRAGNISHDFLLPITIDTTTLTVQPPLLLESSDTGMLNNDRVINKDQPAFMGVAEANTTVRIFARDLGTTTVQLVGENIVGGDLSDVSIGGVNGVGGLSDDGYGLWEITVEPLDDGNYEIFVEVEDWAGNVVVSPPTEIWIDTEPPNTPLLDLTTDTGRHDADNVTFDNTPDFTFTVDDTPNGGNNPFPHDIKYRLYLRPGNAGSNGEILVYDSWQANGNAFVTGGFFTQTIGAALNDGTVAIPDGVYDFKLEVEDRAGNISHDFLQNVTIDRTAPAHSFGDPVVADDGLHPDSDTGVIGQPGLSVDRITSDTTPQFTGRAEADSIVRLFVVTDDKGTSDPTDDDLLQIGQTVATPLDGNQANRNGEWSITTNIDLNDPALGLAPEALRVLRITAEDLAGNVSLEKELEIFVDTLGPRVLSLQYEDGRDVFELKPNDAPSPLAQSVLVTFFDQTDRLPPNFDYKAVNETLALDPGNYNFLGDRVGNVSITSVEFVSSGVGGIPAGGSGGESIGSGSGAVIIDGGDRDDHGSFDGTNNIDGWQFIQQMVNFANNGSSNGAANDILAIGPSSGDALAAITSVANVLGLSLTVVNDADITTANFSDFKMIYVPSDSNTSGGITTAELALLAARKADVQTFVNSGGSLVALTEENQTTPYSWLELPDPFTTAGSASDTQHQTAELVSAGLVITDTELLAGTPVHNSFTGPVGFNGLKPFVFNEGSNGINEAGSGDDQIVTLGLAAGSIGIGSIPGVTYTVRISFAQPLEDDRYTLTVSDRITDDAGNVLDGDQRANEPGLPVQLLPSGDGVPGDNFSGRFTVDSRPEIAVWGQKGIFVDANQSFAFDSPNALNKNFDISSDLVFNVGVESDQIFAGQFHAAGATAANGFDRIGAYGLFGGSFRFLLDTDDDGVIDTSFVSNIQDNGLPVAGNFDGNAANGDEIGLFDGKFWYLDTTGDNLLDTVVLSAIPGLPIVGDFDGDGIEDLGTHVASSNTFFFDFGVDGYGDLDDTFSFGTPGISERPFAGDFDQDGIDDFGLTTKNQNGVSGQATLEWYIFRSNTEVPGAPGSLPANLKDPFSPTPLGDDLFTVYGSDLAVPVVGNFDPPLPALAAPTVSGPSGDTTDTTPNISWTGSTGAVGYEFLLYDTASGQLLAHSANQATLRYSPTLPTGDYQFWVRPTNFNGGNGNWSAPLDFSIIVAPLAAPTLTGPTGSINTTSATISWTGSDGATSYDLLIYNLGTGQQAAAPTGINGTTYAANLGAGRFQVFAQANNATQSSSWSTAMQFDLTGTGASLSVPTLTGPSGGVNAGSVTVTWNTVSGAASYDLLAYNISTGQEVANFSGLTGTSQSVNFVSGQHQVFLRADNGAGTVTNWSTPLVFDVTSSAAAPTVPTLTGPAGTANAGTVAILWTGVSNAAGYDLLVYNIGSGQEVVNAAGITANTFTPSASFSAGSRYQVFLRAVDGSGVKGAWATPLEFDVVSAERLLDATNGMPLLEAAPQQGLLPTIKMAAASEISDALFTVLENGAKETDSPIAVPQTAPTGSPVASTPSVTEDFADTHELDSVLAGWHNTEWWNDAELTTTESDEMKLDSGSNPAPALLLAGAAFGSLTPIAQHRRKAKTEKRTRLQ